MHNNLIVRNKVSQFFKTRQYVIKINGIELGEVNKKFLKAEFELPMGRHLVEISTGDKKVAKEIVFLVNQFKCVFIRPSISYQIMLGLAVGSLIFFIALSIFALFYFDFSLKSFLLFFFILLPIILRDLKSRRSKADFTISTSPNII
jgi:hypothetical protein